MGDELATGGLEKCNVPTWIVPCLGPAIWSAFSDCRVVDDVLHPAVGDDTYTAFRDYHI